ncbi:thiamine ABC transporter substrate-binding protein [Flexilinea flocculi]|uniref:ABC transporter periplasmic binding protein, thiB subfamily n=1 Tax=Flexilinea flocculi TaxID=1678840 RepID=A0A0S7BU38_9CHLR|nr:thiamine ABC transporter substrate-binding protein [Flexilinea flocculi]GAP40708.1 ABC transporter periplasmic binding protein, thiB subfamily [Flexilinea flocculi]
MKKITFLLVLLLSLFVFNAVWAEGNNNILSILTYDSFSVSEDIVAAFEEENQVKIQFIESGDGTTMLNQAILSKEAPIADVIIGLNSIMLSRALENDILLSYESPELANIADNYKMDQENRALPFNFGNVCINYDAAWFNEKGLAVPASWDDLINPDYSGQLVVENPITSTPGIAFLLATIAAYGEDGFIDYWKSLLANKIEIADGWSTAYYTNFSAGGGMGPQPMVVSYDASPAAAPFYAESEMETAPTASILSDGMCYQVVEFLGILKGTQNQELAEKFVDAILGKEWQEDLPGQMFVFPVNKDAVLPDVFTKFALVPENPAMLDPDLINEKRDSWLQKWNDEILTNY